MAKAVLCDRQPLARTALWRTVANTLSMGSDMPPMLGREIVER